MPHRPGVGQDEDDGKGSDGLGGGPQAAGQLGRGGQRGDGQHGDDSGTSAQGQPVPGPDEEHHRGHGEQQGTEPDEHHLDTEPGHRRGPGNGRAGRHRGNRGRGGPRPARCHPGYGGERRNGRGPGRGRDRSRTPGRGGHGGRAGQPYQRLLPGVECLGRTDRQLPHGPPVRSGEVGPATTAQRTGEHGAADGAPGPVGQGDPVDESAGPGGQLLHDRHHPWSRRARGPARLPRSGTDFWVAVPRPVRLPTRMDRARGPGRPREPGPREPGQGLLPADLPHAPGPPPPRRWGPRAGGTVRPSGRHHRSAARMLSRPAP